MYLRNIVCCGYIIVNTLHIGDDGGGDISAEQKSINGYQSFLLTGVYKISFTVQNTWIKQYRETINTGSLLYLASPSEINAAHSTARQHVCVVAAGSDKR